MVKKKLLIKGEVKELTFEELLEEYKAAIKNRMNKYKFLSKLNDVDIEDVHQMIVTGLFNAYKNYDIESGYEFSSRAFMWMNNLCKKKYRNETCRYKVDFYKHDKSLSETLYRSTEGEDLTYEDSLEDEYNLEETVLNKTYISEVINFIKTSFKERESTIVLNLITKNKNQTQLAKELNMSQVQVSRLYRKSLKEIREYLVG